MKIRWKLLLILTCFTLGPLVLLSITSRRASHDLVKNLTANAREVLALRAEEDLLRRLQDHAVIVSKEAVIVSLALKSLADRLQRALEDGKMDTSVPLGDKFNKKDRYFRIFEESGRIPIEVDYSRFRIELAPDATVDMVEAERIMRPLLPSFQRLEQGNNQLVLWQIIRLTNGIIATYPFYKPATSMTTHAMWMNQKSHPGILSEPLPDAESPPHEWFRAAMHSREDIHWISPYRDPVTGAFILSAVGGIQSIAGTFRGAVMFMVPLTSVLQGGLELSELSEGMTSLLFRKGRMPDGKTGLRIVAEELKGVSTAQDRGGWMAGKESRWLSTGDSDRTGQVIEAMRQRKCGAFLLPYKGEDSLWVYAPIHKRSGLMLIVPMQNIYGTTVESAQEVRSQIESHYSTISYILWALAAVVVLLSAFLSKPMTRRLAALSSAFHRLAGGDFSTRVDIKGHDELSELGRTFNKLAPALEDQVRMKKALTIAQEVQRSLLPEQPPSISGLDVAGTSLYCEDTGGDYFDYPHLGIEADEFGLAVGDVSGHGVPAALLMTTARAFLRQRASRGGRLDEVVADANRLLAEDIRLSGRFMTLFLFAVDPETLTARWVRAGHDPALVYSKSSDEFSELGGDTGLPLGVDGDWEYAEESMQLGHGQIILIGTDGIWEAVNPEGEMFGKDRLREIMRIHADNSAQDVLNAILNALRNFTAESGFEDDVTLAVVKVRE